MVTVPVTVAPAAPVGGLAVRKGNSPPFETKLITLSNVYVIDSDVSQKNFEEGMLQYKMMLQGGIDETPLRVRPNADLGTRAQYHGTVVDAGEHKKLTPEDAVPADYEIEVSEPEPEPA
jgi:hypothetical protein